jgi:hypothetical protein
VEHKTETLLELAFAAHRVNNGYEKQTRRYSEDQPTTFSNKELITFTVQTDSWIPEDFVPLQITEEDRAAKAAADKHMRRYTMLAMGDLPQFESDIFSAYASEVMPVNRVGLIAYLPQFVERELQSKIYKQRMKTEFANSKHLEGNIQGNCEILKVIRINKDFNEPFYMHFGAVDGNLVCFARKEGFAEGTVYTISAKVKGQDKERETGLPMTRINYVKLRKTEA